MRRTLISVWIAWAPLCTVAEDVYDRTAKMVVEYTVSSPDVVVALDGKPAEPGSRIRVLYDTSSRAMEAGRASYSLLEVEHTGDVFYLGAFRNRVSSCGDGRSVCSILVLRKNGKTVATLDPNGRLTVRDGVRADYLIQILSQALYAAMDSAIAARTK